MTQPADGGAGEVIARLAAGLSHDLGHLLATVALNLESLARRSPDDAQRGRLRALQAELDTGVALARELAAVARPAALADADAGCHVDQVAAGLVTLVAAAHADADVRAELRCPGVLAAASPLDVRRCLLNLLVNAVDAGARRVLVSTGVVRLAGDEAPAWPPGRRGRFLALDVGDDGPGLLPDEVADAVGGRSSGLGLATTAALLDRFGGALHLIPRPAGGGHDVRLHLPLA